MGITIVSVKIVGVCSKHSSKDNPSPTQKDGTPYPDDDIACIGCMI